MTTLISGRFVICMLGLAMFNIHTKFEVSTITCYEDVKCNTKCRNCASLGGGYGSKIEKYGGVSHSAPAVTRPCITDRDSLLWHSGVDLVGILGDERANPGGVVRGEGWGPPWDGWSGFPLAPSPEKKWIFAWNGILWWIWSGIFENLGNHSH